jgi:hypothetical protein
VKHCHPKGRVERGVVAIEATRRRVGTAHRTDKATRLFAWWPVVPNQAVLDHIAHSRSRCRIYSH